MPSGPRRRPAAAGGQTPVWSRRGGSDSASGDRTRTRYLLLATGYWLLATGYWLLATRYWLLATRYSRLARRSSKQQAASSKQQVASSKQQVARSNHSPISMSARTPERIDASHTVTLIAATD